MARIASVHAIQDVYWGPKLGDVIVLNARAGGPAARSMNTGAKSVSDARTSAFPLVREPTRGLEPLTPCFCAHLLRLSWLLPIIFVLQRIWPGSGGGRLASVPDVSAAKRWPRRWLRPGAAAPTRDCAVTITRALQKATRCDAGTGPGQLARLSRRASWDSTAGAYGSQARAGRLPRPRVRIPFGSRVVCGGFHKVHHPLPGCLGQGRAATALAVWPGSGCHPRASNPCTAAIAPAPVTATSTPGNGYGVTDPIAEDKISAGRADLQADDSLARQRRPASLGQRAQQRAVRHQPHSVHGRRPNTGALDANPSLPGPVGGLRASEGCA